MRLTAAKITSAESELVRENILELNSQPVEDCLQFAQCKMVLSALKAVKCGVGQADLFGELSVRKVASFLPQEFCKLTIEIPLHRPRLSKLSSRMCDDFPLQDSTVLIECDRRTRSWDVSSR
jgi:hypothetical protein